MFSMQKNGWLRSVLLAAVFILGGCSYAPPKGVAVVQPFDAERYLGTWYEIARLDHSFERNLDNVSAVYSKRPDGNIKVINSGYDVSTGERKEATGVAKFTVSPQVASLKVSFFWPFYGGYHVAELDEDYRWALVVGPDHQYLWLLARDPELPTEIKQYLVQRAGELGIDVSGLIWVKHDRPEI